MIAAAVTPVVMISTAATLILGINSKHQSMADRLRSLAGEFRLPSTTVDRRRVIAQQLRWFDKRVHYSALAHRILYISIVLFLLTILLIILAPVRFAWTTMAYVWFVSGVILMLVASAFEFMELWWTNLTLKLELSDVLASIGAEKAPAKHD